MQGIEDINSANELDHCDIIINGDIKFSWTNWETLSSPNPYEIQVLEKIVELNLTQHAKTQHDVVLSSNPELIVTCQVDKLFLKKLSDQFSDHKFYESTLLTTTDCGTIKLKAPISFKKSSLGWSEWFNQKTILWTLLLQ